ncbi:carbohydrate ABC transporter permease [Brachybacterium paraconglomeratum]|uniref:carbohydrate ABC transporter permease n=1 Tax=Brachybacterium paraconglomeratum TaxID=173362 RepID=UPI00223B426A|nr:carbohydrate ABC transporter permease [Brachybacterium paraconglomeratum]MCT1437802.1 carbohydrate ABC transporter permease [Brachybacterium paraconglomeratum]
MTLPAANRPTTWTSTSRTRVRPRDVVRTVNLTALALLVLVPLVWTVLGSFKSPTELSRRPPALLPEQWMPQNYVEALTGFDVLRYLTNSVIVVVVATLLTLAINSMAAYALARYNFRGREVLFLVTLATIMVPLQVILIPVYQVTAALGLTNSLWGVILPAIATPTGVFLLRQYMLTIPDELIDSARMDGAREFGIFWRVVLPLCRPALAVLAIFSVLWRWNDFLWPLVVTNERTRTLPVALQRFASQEVVPFNLVLAISVVSLVPVLICFLVFQRQIVQGIAATGMK